MAGTDLDAIIRKLAKQQHNSLTAAVKAGRDRYLALAGKSKDAAAKQRYRQMAKHAMEQGTTAVRRLQMSADNAADSYARAMRKAAEAALATKVAPVKRKPEKSATGPKARTSASKQGKTGKANT
jgi:hypothetical protein